MQMKTNLAPLKLPPPLKQMLIGMTSSNVLNRNALEVLKVRREDEF